MQPYQWFYVTGRFLHLQANLALQAPDVDDASTKVEGVVKCLNRFFYGESVMDRYLVAGSWGKNTAIRPPSDVDLFFIMPNDCCQSAPSQKLPDANCAKSGLLMLRGHPPPSQWLSNCSCGLAMR